MVQNSKSLNIDHAARPPIVVVMGHIDHGKTTLLDYIRKSGVAAKESGGITQHIGAYEAEVWRQGSDKADKITFLDTPGHEAFSKMRVRGAKVADVAILVVAADDGVKPQTKEAISAIGEAKIPFMVAINKIDKPSADVERAKSDLAEAGVFLEGRGGTVPYVEISAKQGLNIDKLLDTVLLISELEDCTADLSLPAEGVVIESHRNAKRGNTSTLLLRNGVLRFGEYVAAGDAVAKVKIFENFLGQPIKEAFPSEPIVLVGFDKVPQVGFEFQSFSSQKEATEAAAGFKLLDKKAVVNGAQGGEETENKKKVVGLVIKADVTGSVEAIEHEIAKIDNERAEIKFLRAEAGDISEDDIKLASSSPYPIVVGFKVSVRPEIRELSSKMKIDLYVFDIIYEIYDLLKKKIDEIAPPVKEETMSGKAKIIKIFPYAGKNQIVGGEVLEGSLKKGSLFEVFRRNNKIGEGKVDNLQKGRVNTEDVVAGEEFGAMCAAKVSIAPGDTLICFK